MPSNEPNNRITDQIALVLSREMGEPLYSLEPVSLFCR